MMPDYGSPYPCEGGNWHLPDLMKKTVAEMLDEVSCTFDMAGHGIMNAKVGDIGSGAPVTVGKRIARGHSVHSRFLTSAAAGGAPVWDLAEVSRHKSLDTLRGSGRWVDLFFREHAARRSCKRRNAPIDTENAQ